MIPGNTVFHVFEHGSSNDVWWKGKVVVVFCKVIRKPSLRRDLVLKQERYGNQCNGFDVKFTAKETKGLTYGKHFKSITKDLLLSMDKKIAYF